MRYDFIDPFHEETRGLAGDLDSRLTRMWDELDVPGDDTDSAAPELRNVFLECCGKLADMEAVRLLAVFRNDYGVESLQFSCPCCGGHHESLRFP